MTFGQMRAEEDCKEEEVEVMMVILQTVTVRVEEGTEEGEEEEVVAEGKNFSRNLKIHLLQLAKKKLIGLVFKNAMLPITIKFL